MTFLKFPLQVEITIGMRDDDEFLLEEIDDFEIILPLPFDDIQEKEYSGNRGIAKITLSTEFKCIEPDACNSSESTGTR